MNKVKKTIEDFDLKGKKVIIRCDFNVSIKEGIIKDDTRIKEALPTIKYALEKGAKVILMSHLGKVKEESDLRKNSLEPVYKKLKELLNNHLYFSPVTRGKELEDKVGALKEGEALLIQNTRYEDLDGKKESTNDKKLAQYWASLGDIFINDAFGTIHRNHASNVGIASNLENGIGFLVQKELDNLRELNDPKRPYVVILGGAKVTDKIKVIENLAPKADYILIGGGMAFTFLKAEGLDVGKSLVDEENLSFAEEMMKKYKDKIVLPIDVLAFNDFNEESVVGNKFISELNFNLEGLDIGINSIELFKEVIKKAYTVFWNGPLGVYEFINCQEGTDEIFKEVIKRPLSIIGGGDIVGAAQELGYKDKVSFSSTGGGATLDYLSGLPLPGYEIINDK